MACIGTFPNRATNALAITTAMVITMNAPASRGPAPLVRLLSECGLRSERCTHGVGVDTNLRDSDMQGTDGRLRSDYECEHVHQHECAFSMRMFTAVNRKPVFFMMAMTFTSTNE